MFPGLGMLDGVVDGFLGDEVEVGRDEVVGDEDRLGAVERAGHLPFLPGPVGEVGQCGHEPLGIDRDGEQPLDDGPELLLAALQSQDHPLDQLRRIRGVFDRRVSARSPARMLRAVSSWLTLSCKSWPMRRCSSEAISTTSRSSSFRRVMSRRMPV